MAYPEALDLQHRLVDARFTGALGQDVLLLLEHTPVFTLGRRGNREHVLVHEAFLRSRGIEVVQAERGGDVTFHGPGQLVGYTILDLRAMRLGVVDLVESLEEVMIRTLGDWQIPAHRNPRNRGVWVEDNKVGSVGIAIRRQVSFHGFALNVNTRMEPFTWIHPCGLEGTRTISMKEVLRREISMERVRTRIGFHVQEIFRAKLEKRWPEDMPWLVAKRSPKAIGGSYEDGL
jgi:lipoate-protein ligase B